MPYLRLNYNNISVTLFMHDRLQVHSPSITFSEFRSALSNVATGFGLMILYGCYFLRA